MQAGFHNPHTPNDTKCLHNNSECANGKYACTYWWLLLYSYLTIKSKISCWLKILQYKFNTLMQEYRMGLFNASTSFSGQSNIFFSYVLCYFLSQFIFLPFLFLFNFIWFNLIFFLWCFSLACYILLLCAVGLFFYVSLR